MTDKLFKPGEDDKPAGEYIEVDENDVPLEKPHRVTIDPGDRLPPTTEKDHEWEEE